MEKIATIQSEIVAEFAAISDWEARYKRIIEVGRSLKAMPEALKIDENKVKGCQSSVWMIARLENGNMIIEADSDASIVKGLVALLVKVYSGQTPDAVLSHAPDFLQKIGLNTHLSQTRVNGLVSMVKQIKFYAIAFQAFLEKAP
jgi:cysteine desulfuration protein SufE